jgi:hypothetical protein
MMTGSDEPANDHADVLFVGLDAEALTADVRRVVEQRRCVFLGDVYRALARVPRISPAVVVIGVDWLPEAAFEVFELLARRDRDLTVLVAGSERATAKIELARARGATGVLDAQALIDGLPPLRNDAGAADTSADNPETPVRSTAVMDPPASPATPGGKKTDTFASPGNVFDAELDRRLRGLAQTPTEDDKVGDSGRGFSDLVPPAPAPAPSAESEHPYRPEAAPQPSADNAAEEVGEAVEDESGTCDDLAAYHSENVADGSGSTVRVPWGQYADRPVRVAPQRIPPAKAGPTSSAGAPSSTGPSSAGPWKAVIGDDEDADDPPLLSADEIAALMGKS